MRLFLLFPLALLAACESVNAPAANLAPDDCNAKSYQNLIGTSVETIDASVLPEKTRIIHPDTAVTHDYRLDRLNVHVDGQGKITRVVCG